MSKWEKINWQEVASKFGFDCYDQMFQVLYVQRGNSIREMATITGISPPTIAKTLKENGFDIIDNRGKCLGTFVCQFCKREFPGDKRRVCCDNDECVDEYKNQINIKKNQERKNKQKRSEDNKCIMCGKDKGKNRFYCYECHSSVSSGMLFDA